MKDPMGRETLSRVFKGMIRTASLGASLLALVTLSASVTAASSPADEDETGLFCSNTSRAALRACRNESKDDFWITIGNCNNLPDDDAREECLTGARLAIHDALKDCADQFEARQEICEALGEAPYDPDLGTFEDPLSIGTSVPVNLLFPLVPGVRKVFRNEVEGETTTVSVTRDTKEILGVNCIVVSDIVSDSESGEVLEDTEDYFAQDVDGNVWYFGELSQEFEDGDLVSLEGSWKAGRDFAKQGILMAADPMVGDVYRQEFFLGDAEDLGEVLSLSGSATVPLSSASCDGNCFVSKDFTPLEPGTFEEKFYTPRIGVILEFNPETGARTELVEMSTF
ncbi:MAG: hypothetical protein ACE5HD_12600 [Acidobacteriota bacterium]